jgi:hypothetical protein
MPISSTAYLALVVLGLLGVCSGGAVLADWHGYAVRSYDRRVDPALAPAGGTRDTRGFERYRRWSVYSRLLLGVVLLALAAVSVL